MIKIGKTGPARVLLVHLALSFACIIATFPVFRVVAISFRNTDTVASTETLKFPPRGEASFGDYVQFFGDAVIPYELFRSPDIPEGMDTVDEGDAAPTDEDLDDFEDEFASLDAEDEKPKIRYWYSNYVDLFTEYLFLQWIYNSLIIAFSASFIGVFLAATTAYAFARFNFPGKQFANGFLFTTQMIPAPMMIIPVYLVVKSLNLGNTYAGLVLAMSVTTLPFSIMVLRGYFETIPKSLEDAARVDGCNPISTFFRILLPLSTPALAIAFLFSFTSAWTEFLLASTLIDDVELRPWTLGLMEFSGSFDSRWGLFAAGSVVIAIPSMMLFLYSSKYVVSGLTVGSVKG
ncbi:sugar ABC transporter permease [Pseudobacteriovorax antillogorgiicola]|nr:carbohydrate ABC transporter permease [Pseudobacteriovorax antillogorgiicola]